MNRPIRAALIAVLLAACGGSVGGTRPDSTGPPLDANSTTMATVTTSSSGVSAPVTSRASTSTSVVTSTVTSSAGRATTAPTVSQLPSDWSQALVVSVTDGDTIDVRLEDGRQDTVRLIGINSPERGECYASEARDGLARLIDGETVALEPDRSDRDQFGRLLRYVWTTDDRLVNEIAVENGWALARAYPPDTSRAGQLEAAQQGAMATATGLWSPDACGAAVAADVRISHVEYDAEGDDNHNQNGEWVDIVNGDDLAVDLTGWMLKDESATHRFRFPDGFTLQPEDSVRVHTGCGQDTEATLYWCVSGSAVWNNSGDTAFLLDPGGNIVFSYSYG